MPRIRNYKGVDIPGFAGGLNTKDGPGGIADNQLADGMNVYLIKGNAVKRKGYERWNSSARIDTAEAGMAIFDAPFTSGDQIIGVAGSKISKKGSGAWTDISGSVTVTTNNYAIPVMINNNLVMVNGNDPAWYYSGTGNAITLSGNNIPTAPTVCEAFHGRLFLATGRQLVWGDYMGKWNNPFPNDNDQNFEDNIKGLKVLGDSNNSVMLVFTEGRTHLCRFDPAIGLQVGGKGTFRFDTISETDGCVSPTSVQECVTRGGDKVVIWADRDGLKGCGADLKIRKLTENIQPTWNDLNASQLSNATSAFYRTKRWYMLSCANGAATTHDRIIIYDLENGVTITPFDLVISNFGVVKESGKDVLIGSDYSGYWNKYDTTQNDNGTAINGWFMTKAYDGEMPLHSKAWLNLAMSYSWLGSYSVDITVYFDRSIATYSETVTLSSSGLVGAATLDLFVLDQDKLGENEQLVIQSVGIRGHGRVVQLKIANNNTGEPFRFYRNILGFKPTKMMMAT